ncbi:MAG TPA: hypothetical protein VFZ81_05780 [Burkholderiales bacterium]
MPMIEFDHERLTKILAAIPGRTPVLDQIWRYCSLREAARIQARTVFSPKSD